MVIIQLYAYDIKENYEIILTRVHAIGYLANT